MRASCSGDLLQHRLVGHLREVGTLDISRNTVQGSSQSVLRRSVHHLRSDWGGVWRPSEEHNLVSLSLTITDLVLKVVDGVLALVFRQLLQKGIVLLIGGGLLHNNFSLVIVYLVDNELVLLAQLQVVEGLQGFVSNGNTGVSMRSRRIGFLRGNIPGSGLAKLV